MIRKLALLCCILLLPTIAAAENTNYGDFWVGGQIGGVFTLNRNLNFEGPFGGEFTGRRSISTDPAFSAGAIAGYNFCMPYRQPWERYFGVALDFQWNQFNQSVGNFASTSGSQYALGFLARGQYPLMGDETFTRGKWVPFIMAGPAVVWTTSGFSNFGGSKTSTDIGVLVELGFEYFVMPQLSIGPSFRYRHVFGPNNDFQNVKISSNLDQFMILARLAYHF